jgi:hypothetical protein
MDVEVAHSIAKYLNKLVTLKAGIPQDQCRLYRYNIRNEDYDCKEMFLL